MATVNFKQDIRNWVIIPVLILVIPLLPFIFLYRVIEKFVLFLAWQYKHRQHGREFLVIYSESSKWSNYFKTEVVPLLTNRAVVVNTTENSKWKASRSVERRAHLHWGGDKDHTPLILMFPKVGRVRCFRFHQEFLALAKRGDPTELASVMDKLRAAAQLNSSPCG